MRLKYLLVVPVATAAISAMAMAPATAGEVTGNGKGTQGPAHAHSICVFSGLEDGDKTTTHPRPQPAGPGTTQNWGQIPKAIRDVIATQGEHPGDACNGHTGFLAGGGGE